LRSTVTGRSGTPAVVVVVVLGVAVVEAAVVEAGVVDGVVVAGAVVASPTVVDAAPVDDESTGAVVSSDVPEQPIRTKPHTTTRAIQLRIETPFYAYFHTRSTPGFAPGSSGRIGVREL
jgi:hypothetical protein